MNEEGRTGSRPGSESPLFLVTGAAGFIGSNLADRLLESGFEVVGIDCFRSYYPVSIKRANLQPALANPRFDLLEVDLASGDLDLLGERTGRDRQCVIIHLAARPGVRDSWGNDFATYASDNIMATQRLLEWAARRGRIANFVFASSSSVYGNARKLPLSEMQTVPCPHSPYGVTKLAAENLVRLYGANLGLPSVSLRFFSVYGPRQRPDMALHRFLLAAFEGRPVEVFGGGDQTRDFTCVDDLIDGILAACSVPDGAVYNLGGGHRVSVLEVLSIIERVVGREVLRIRSEQRPGDVADTLADLSLAREKLGWNPRRPLEEGIAQEAGWLKAAYRL